MSDQGRVSSRPHKWSRGCCEAPHFDTIHDGVPGRTPSPWNCDKRGHVPTPDGRCLACGEPCEHVEPLVYVGGARCQFCGQPEHSGLCR